MAATDSIMYSLERNWEMVEAAIADLDYDTMARLPNEQSNSVSWIFGTHQPGYRPVHHAPATVQTAVVVRRRLVREIRAGGKRGWPGPHR